MWLTILFIAGLTFYFIHTFFSNTSEKRSSDKYKDKFVLKNQERKFIDLFIPLAEEHFNHLVFCVEETIRFYIRIFRDLPPNKQKDYMLNRKFIQYCICLIKTKYDYKPEPADQLLTLQKNLFSGDITLIDKHAEFILPLIEQEEIKLFTLDNQRWKRKYEGIIQTFEINKTAPASEINTPDNFYEKILQLASLNKKVRLADTRNIFYKSYLFMVEHHKETSLKLYLHYLNVKSSSETFQHKQISTRNTSKLFNKGQKAKFDTICKKLIKSQKLDEALKEVSEFYQPVRRKIHLNIESIQEVNSRQAKIAKILGTYLDDEPIVETSANIEPIAQINTTENNRQELFNLFITNGYHLNQQEVNIFAQSKGFFKDQFIESINEQYYETLDDLLIEESEEGYILNEDYYKEIINNTAPAS